MKKRKAEKVSVKGRKINLELEKFLMGLCNDIYPPTWGPYPLRCLANSIFN